MLHGLQPSLVFEYSNKELAFANEKKLGTVQWVEEKASGKINWKKRRIAEVIDVLKPGDNILLANYGNGADAFIIKATSAIETLPKRRGIKGHMESNRDL